MNDKPEKNAKEAAKEAEREKPFENEPSSLDEQTHSEMELLYREATDTLRFAKYIQWWTVGSTLLVFFAFIAIAKFVNADMAYAKVLTALTIFIAMSGIFSLIMYQFWQYNELRKIAEMSKHFSSLFRRVRGVKSKTEANFHRYTLLFFMITTIVIGAIVAYHGVNQVVDNRPGNPNVTIYKQ